MATKKKAAKKKPVAKKTTAPRKTAKKAAKVARKKQTGGKAAKKTVRKPAKKAARKSVKTAAKKSAKKAAGKQTKSSAKKTAKKAKSKAKSKTAASKIAGKAASKKVAAKAAPLSVHLIPWPTHDKKLFDASILTEGDIVLKAANLGRAARQGSGVRVRQPLGVMMVHAVDHDAMDAVRNNEDVLKDELNVKTIEYLSDSAGVLEYRLKPNLPRLGPRYGKRMGVIKGFLEKANAREIAAKVAAEESLTVPATDGGEDIELEHEDVLVESISREGTAGAEGGGLLVAFDTQLTPELLEEGLVRDLVRSIQELRKTSGLEVTDRIRLEVQGASDAVDRALEKYRAYVEEETLAHIDPAAFADNDEAPVGRAGLPGKDAAGEILIWKL